MMDSGPSAAHDVDDEPAGLGSLWPMDNDDACLFQMTANELLEFLFAAIDHNDLASVQNAVTAGADVDARNRAGVCALQLAIQKKVAADILRALIAASAEMPARTTGEPQLRWALQFRNVAAVSVLLEAGVNPNDCSCVLWEAIRSLDATQILPMLVAHGLRLHDEDYMRANPGHANPLHAALIHLDQACNSLIATEHEIASGSALILDLRRRDVARRADTVVMLLSYGLRLPSPDEIRYNDAVALARRCLHVLRPVILREAWARRRAAVLARSWCASC